MKHRRSGAQPLAEQLQQGLYTDGQNKRNGHQPYSLFSHNPYLPQQIKWKTEDAGPAPGMPDSIWATDRKGNPTGPLYVADGEGNWVPYQGEPVTHRVKKIESNEPLYRRFLHGVKDTVPSAVHYVKEHRWSTIPDIGKAISHASIDTANSMEYALAGAWNYAKANPGKVALASMAGLLVLVPTLAACSSPQPTPTPTPPPTPSLKPLESTFTFSIPAPTLAITPTPTMAPTQAITPTSVMTALAPTPTPTISPAPTPTMAPAPTIKPTPIPPTPTPTIKPMPAPTMTPPPTMKPTPIPSTPAPTPTPRLLIQSDPTKDYWPIHERSWYVQQSFGRDEDFNLTGLMLYLGKEGNPPVALQGKIGKEGEDKALTTFVVQNSDIIEPSGQWFQVPLRDRVDIKANKYYQIVLSCEPCTVGDSYKWFFAKDGTSIDGHAAKFEVNPVRLDKDFAFEMHGTVTPAPPAITISSVGGDSSEPYEITDTMPDIVFKTDENAWCRASWTDESYDKMASVKGARGEGTTEHTFTLPSVGELRSYRQLKEVYIGCTDSAQNKTPKGKSTRLVFILEPVVPLGANEVRNAGFETDDNWQLSRSNPNPNTGMYTMSGERVVNAVLKKMLAQYPALTRGSNEWPREGATSYLLGSKGDLSPNDYVQIMQENADFRGAKKLVFSINARTNAGASEPYYLHVLAGPKGQETEIFKMPLDYTITAKIDPSSGMNIADPAKFDISTSELPSMGTGNLIIRLSNPKITTATAQVMVDNLRKVPR